jgi:hypothetical protein
MCPVQTVTYVSGRSDAVSKVFFDFVPIDFQPFHVANLCNMKPLISNDFQKVLASPRDIDATWRASTEALNSVLRRAGRCGEYHWAPTHLFHRSRR